MNSRPIVEVESTESEERVAVRESCFGCDRSLSVTSGNRQEIRVGMQWEEDDCIASLAQHDRVVVMVLMIVD